MISAKLVRTATAAAGVFVAVTASAAGPAHAQAPAAAVVRAAHFSPTTPGVDVYLTSFAGKKTTEWLSGVRYGAVSAYRQLTPGLYTVSMRRHGASPSSAAVLSWTLDARAGAAYTAAAVGTNSALHGIVLDDSLQSPAPGDGRVRVIQAASRAPLVTVRAAHGPTIVRSAAFASATSYSSVAAGRWTVQAASVSDPALRASSTVRIRSGQIQSVLVLDAAHRGITVRALVDSSSAANAPSGPVPAGGGGTATQFVRTSGLSWRDYALGGVGTAALVIVLSTAYFRLSRRNRPRHARALG